MLKKLIIFSVLLIINSHDLFCQEYSRLPAKNYLAGIKEFKVKAKILTRIDNNEQLLDIIPEYIIQKDVEIILKKNGMKLISDFDKYSVPAELTAEYHIIICSLKISENTWSFFLTLKVMQVLEQVHSKKSILSAIWSKYNMVSYSVEEIRTGIRDSVEKGTLSFVRDYFKVNY